MLDVCAFLPRKSTTKNGQTRDRVLYKGLAPSHGANFGDAVIASGKQQSHATTVEYCLRGPRRNWERDSDISRYRLDIRRYYIDGRIRYQSYRYRYRAIVSLRYRNSRAIVSLSVDIVSISYRIESVGFVSISVIATACRYQSEPSRYRIGIRRYRVDIVSTSVGSMSISVNIVATDVD